MKGKLIREKENHYTLLMEGINDLSGIVASTEFENEYTKGKLSIKNCQAIERGYDLDDKIINHLENNHIEASPKRVNVIKQLIIELFEDKRYCEKDIEKAFDAGYETLDSAVRYNDALQELKNSLPQTKWDVIFNPDEKDLDGCLILKRI